MSAKVGGAPLENFLAHTRRKLSTVVFHMFFMYACLMHPERTFVPRLVDPVATRLLFLTL